MNWIDSAVLGGETGTKPGELCAMVGGNCDAIDYLRPILSRLTNRVMSMGPNGCGQAAKVCN
ncbi:MAG: 3-hydroxyisobutyrate dehydrogenase-like beta-hydroxyacid dehydrogenase [Arenicella sp.]|jgi:3-hydroxyisobutyrate dehydrogenase-like beta-hydroxyacid dehydrogenase